MGGGGALSLERAPGLEGVREDFLREGVIGPSPEPENGTSANTGREQLLLEGRPAGTEWRGGGNVGVDRCQDSICILLANPVSWVAEVAFLLGRWGRLWILRREDSA